VGLATDVEGAVLGLQCLYVTDDGEKAPKAETGGTDKRTYKSTVDTSWRRDLDEPGGPADKNLTRQVAKLLARGLKVAVAVPTAGKDFNDVLMLQGEAAVQAAIAVAVAELEARAVDWRGDLIEDGNRRPKSCLANAAVPFRKAHEECGVGWT
jgi:hypothetical protein